MDLKPIFVFSLPRSGSTLLQRVLGAHPLIHTVAEPHFLIPFVFSYRRDGVFSSYRHAHTADAIVDLWDQLPNGRQDYFAAIRSFAMNIFDKATPRGMRYFLDKTPLYSLIAQDLIEIFPDGKFVFLWRNPLSVVASLSDTYGKGKWNAFLYKHELITGLRTMIDASRACEASSFTLRYEDLLLDPDSVLAPLFEFLGLDYQADVLEKISNLKVEAKRGDPTGVKRYTSLSREPLEKWRASFSTKPRKIWGRGYIRLLGEDYMNAMGYDIGEVLAQLRDVPESLSGSLSDSLRMIRGLFYCMLETPQVKKKLLSLKRFDEVIAHT